MQKSDNSHMATTAHRKVKSSTTLNRRYVSKPSKSIDMTVPVRRSSKIRHFDMTPNLVKKHQDDQSIAPATIHPMQAKVISKMQNRSMTPIVSGMTAKELKDRAIKKALSEASKITSDGKNEIDESEKNVKMHFGLGRILLALSCAAVAVFAIVYFVNLNMPDISMRVAAMQTGIEASYPGYVPREFSLSSITSEDGKVILDFKNSGNGDSFSLIEENSSWDSNALMTNFVKVEYGEDYSMIREQGLTIYVKDSDATWVNGGIVYKIKTTSGSLSKKQIRSIAVSL